MCVCVGGGAAHPGKARDHAVAAAPLALPAVMAAAAAAATPLSCRHKRASERGPERRGARPCAGGEKGCVPRRQQHSFGLETCPKELLESHMNYQLHCYCKLVGNTRNFHHGQHGPESVDTAALNAAREFRPDFSFGAAKNEIVSKMFCARHLNLPWFENHVLIIIRRMTGCNAAAL